MYSFPAGFSLKPVAREEIPGISFLSPTLMRVYPRTFFTWRIEQVAVHGIAPSIS